MLVLVCAQSTGEDFLLGAGARGVENLDGVEVDLLGDTISGTTDSAGNVGAVTVAVGIGAITGSIVQPGSTSTELGVSGVDASVNDIGANTGTGGIVIGIAGTAGSLVGDASKAPRSAGLSDIGVDLNLGILLDVLDLRALVSV